MTISRDDPNHGVFAWATVALGLLAIVSWGVGVDQLRQFNNACGDAGRLLPDCYSDRLSGGPHPNDR